MPASLTRFEVQLPEAQNVGDPVYIAIQNFLNSLSSLCPYISIQEPVHTTGDLGQYSSVVQVVYGVFPVAQNSTALGYLNTLDAALNAAGQPNAVCIVWPVTGEP